MNRNFLLLFFKKEGAFFFSCKMAEHAGEQLKFSYDIVI